MRRFGVIAVAIALTACNSIEVAKVDATKNPISKVCIQSNPKVLVEDFVSVMQDAFESHGIATEVFTVAPPSSCEYQLTYTARRSWDMAPYLAYAEIRLLKAGRQVGKIDYDHNNGLSLVKWEGTKAKIGPLLEEMLSGFLQGQAPAQSSSTAVALDSAAATDSGPLSKADWQKEQLQILQQSGVSYEEYQRRYNEIMSQ